MKNKEIIFIVEESPEGGYTAKALEYSIITEADNWEKLKENIRDAVKCHFEKKDRPKIIHLHEVREERLAV
ncbi:MAG: 2-oxoisovalerate dehydrogenase [bacterium]